MWDLLRRFLSPALSVSALSLSVIPVLADDRPIASSVSPIAATSTGAPTVQPARFVTLARPQPLPAPTPVDAVESRPGLARPLPLVRAKTDDEARPLPQAPAPKIVDMGGDDIFFQPARPQLIQVPQAQSKDPKGKIEPVPAPREETIPNQPRLVPQPQMHTMPVPLTGDGAAWDITHGTFSSADCGCLTDCDPCGTTCTPCAPCTSCFGGDCYPRGKLWVRGEYLLWTFRTPQVPALVTTTNSGPPGPTSGALNQVGTQVLYGGSNFDNLMRSGGRVSAGFWFPNHDDWGLDASFFFLGQRTTNFSANSNGNPVLSRPLINTVTGQEGVEPVATTNLIIGGTPGFLLRGGINVDYASKLWGLDANVRKKAWCGPWWHVDVLFGYRHIELEEDLRIQENLTTVLVPGSLSVNTLIADNFSARNNFNGGQVGIEAECRFLNRWFASGQVKVAVGNMHQIYYISGSQTFISSAGGPVVSVPSGIFAGTTNSGRYERNRLAIVPEVNLKVGLDITSQLRIFVGYNFLYMSSVARPGDAIDRVVNPDRIVRVGVNENGTLFKINPSMTGPARPAFFFRGSEFWAQGLNAGLEYHY